MKKCKSCNAQLPYTEFNGIKTYKQKYGYGIDCMCFRDWLISEDPKAIKTFNKFLIKHKKDCDAKKKKEEKQIKNDIVDWKSKLQIKINEIVRLIDVGLPCLAKGIHANQMHAGHVYARGGNQTIRYNLHNIHRQSAQSNHFQNDDGLLREGLAKEYGQEYMDFISELRQTPHLEYKNHEYLEFTKRASKIVLELKKRGLTNDLKDRIKLRNDINNKLEIYDKKYCEFKITKL